VGDWLRAMLTRRPDAIVVELGVPHPGLDGAVRIDTDGAARVCGQAAAKALAGRTLTCT
jgi:beta-N-acetylhexosaminidase